MMMSTLGDIVSKSAPLLGAVLNSFLPGSGLIISGLASIFGGSSSNADDLANRIAADSNAAEKLKEFEIEHQNDLAKIMAADRASARDMNIQTTKALGKTDYMMHFLAGSVVVGALSYPILGNILHYPVDKGIFHDMLNLAMLPLSFYFGGMYVQARNILENAKQNDIVLPPPAKTR